MTAALILIYVISVAATGACCIEEAWRAGVIHTAEVVAGLFMTFCPVVNTGIIGFTLVMLVEHWCEKRGWNRVFWRRKTPTS